MRHTYDRSEAWRFLQYAVIQLDEVPHPVTHAFHHLLDAMFPNLWIGIYGPTGWAEKITWLNPTGHLPLGVCDRARIRSIGLLCKL